MCIKDRKFQSQILRFSRSNHSSQVSIFPKTRQSNMIFTRIVSALLIAAVSVQALYIPDVLYAREFEEFSELSERGPDQLRDQLRDALAGMSPGPRLKFPGPQLKFPALKFPGPPLKFPALKFPALRLRSEDVLSDTLVTRTQS